MFESSAVESRRIRVRRSRLTTLPISILAHGAAFAGVLFAGVWNVDLPADAPPQIAAFVMRVPAPVPAGGGGGAAKPAPRPAHREAAPRQDTAPPLQPAEDTVPSAIPDAIPEIEPGSGSSDAGGGDGIMEGFGTGEGTGSGPGLGDGTGEGTGEGAPLPVGGGVTAPVVLRRVEPRYPDLLVKLRTRGVAVVECVVDREGNIESAVSVASTHPLFAQAAMEAVRQWRFRPGTLNGRPVKTIFRLNVTFALNR